MTDSNLILEILKKIQHDLGQLKDDVRDIKMRLSTLESETRHGFFYAAESSARQQVSIDRMAERIERIENRLDLAEH